MIEPLSVLAGWAIPKIGESLLEIVSGQGWDSLSQALSKSDVDKAIKAGEAAVKEWEKQLAPSQRLFFQARPDGWNGVNNFLRDYFTHSAVLAELQKPLLNQGKPDREILITVFQQQAEGHNIKLNHDSLKLWVETFINAYFQQTDTYLKFQVAKQDYCEQLANWFDDVKFAGIAVPGQEVEKSEKLAQIFVMPDVVEDLSTAGAWERDWLAAGSGEMSETTLLAKTTGRKFLAEQLLSQSQSRRVVILGAPGSGKTTLMSYFAVMLAQQNPEILGLDGDTDWLPILIRMRDFAINLDKSLIDYARVFAENTMSVKPLPVGFFEHWLYDGRALILLDGLDEVAEDAKRNDVVRRIENFLGQFDRNRAIITSRPAGYRRDFFRTEEFPHYQIEPFDDQKISAFIDNWYNSRFQDQAEAERRKQSLRKALDDNDRIKLLARNPLLLTIIALIHRYQAVLPKERFELYNCAVKTLLTSWDANKEISSHGIFKYLDLYDLRRLMELLAYWIHTQVNVEDNDSGTLLDAVAHGGNPQDRAASLIDRDELIDQLSQQIKTLKQVQLYQAKEEAEAFVTLIRDRTGLLNEQGQNCYGFVHKTFQEYLCAEEIDYQADNEGDFEIVLSQIREHLHDSHWREVLLLLIAQQKPKKAARAIRAVLTNKSNYEQWLHRDLLFAGSCLAEDPKNFIGADRGLVQEILQQLFELEVSSKERVGEKIREQVFQIICSFYETDFKSQVLELLEQQSHRIDDWRLLNYRAELGEKDQVITILLAQLKDQNSDVRVSAADALDKLSNSSETVINALLAKLQDENSDVRWRAARSLGKLGNSSETVVSILLARLQDPDPDVRGWVADALSRLGNSSETVVSTLLARLQDPDPDVRVSAAEALGKLYNSSETVVSTLLARLQDDDYFVRWRAARALGNLGNSSQTVVSALIPRLQDDNYFVRGQAARGLGKLGNSSETVVSALLARLQDDQSNVRGQVARALGNLGNSSETVVNALISRLQDDHYYVRGKAALALGNLGNSSETVVNALLALLQDDQSYVRQGTALALGNSGNSSEAVVNALLALLQDNDSFVRSSAAEALGKLGKTSNHVLPTVIKWIEQHQDSDYVGRGIDALWDLVVGEE
ncbi:MULTISPECIES: sister chromatid cohesion protein PDS5 [unclassified Moorena]|uniref:sister chromatid cohesion protein PDS5 n=1 Tax=unclassified Moorena TaxID=2683338 RepID=UPI0013CBF62D|nr:MULTISPECIES: sister chromatid cohesion protein PDS5 [unclassified Moorena]NEO23473.1 NACHT domain-containing protein [Moorena sp. SIO4A5]NEQ57146.1 NACHT domain-containing protein [Moorena sp. SIO4A1]